MKVMTIEELLRECSDIEGEARGGEAREVALEALSRELQRTGYGVAERPRWLMLEVGLGSRGRVDVTSFFVPVSRATVSRHSSSAIWDRSAPLKRGIDYTYMAEILGDGWEPCGVFTTDLGLPLLQETRRNMATEAIA